MLFAFAGTVAGWELIELAPSLASKVFLALGTLALLYYAMAWTFMVVGNRRHWMSVDELRDSIHEWKEAKKKYDEVYARLADMLIEREIKNAEEKK